jgi:spermidine synthase
MTDIVAPRHGVRIGKDSGRAALLVDGVVQSISPEDGLSVGGYWAAMLPDQRPAQVLILGLGGGTLASLMQARWGAPRIVGVDDDEAILRVAQHAGWLPTGGLEIVMRDAFEFVQTCHERFDYIAVDLFRGPRMPGRVFGKPFLRRLRSLLEPRGWLAVNLFRDRWQADRVSRIALFFEIRAEVAVGGNVVVHARNRRRD